MENAVEALKMAGAVLLFIIGLSIAILSFSQAREGIDAVIKYSDREYYTIAGDSRFYYIANQLTGTNRYVGKETIIPTIYRSYKENFKIIFKFPLNSDYYLYKDRNGESISIFDFQTQQELNINSDLASRQFANGILYGDFEYELGKGEEDFNSRFNVKANSTKSLYEYIEDMENNYLIKESLGTYYINDIANDPSDTEGGASIEDINKTEKRVITYEFIPK